MAAIRAAISAGTLGRLRAQFLDRHHVATGPDEAIASSQE
jgi:hypothetical protein